MSPFPSPIKATRAIRRANAKACANLGLVNSTLIRIGITPSHPDWDDLVQEGRIALMNASRSPVFDPARAKFSTYASRAVFSIARRRRFQEIGRKSRLKVRFGFDFGRLGCKQSDRTGDGLRALEKEEAVQGLHRAIGVLDERELAVINLRFSHDAMTLGQVGEIVGLTKERVRQIQRDALAKLRAEMEAE